jgi:biopolymer transport protein ExbB/TolQ
MGSIFAVVWVPVLAAPEAESQNFILEYLDAGGWMMYVILTVSIVGLMIFLERVFNFYILRRLNATAFVTRLVDHVEHRRFREALDSCEISSKHPLVEVIKAGLLRANRREKEIERAMENEMLSALPALQKRVTLMSVMANIATLLGLLGTIFGLIAAFSSVAAASAAERQEALAAGISQAMYTTAFGISVAVPLLLFHHILSKRVETILMEIEGGASALLVAITGVAHEARQEQDGQV